MDANEHPEYLWPYCDFESSYSNKFGQFYKTFNPDSESRRESASWTETGRWFLWNYVQNLQQNRLLPCCWGSSWSWVRTVLLTLACASRRAPEEAGAAARADGEGREGAVPAVPRGVHWRLLSRILQHGRIQGRSELCSGRTAHMFGFICINRIRT